MSGKSVLSGTGCAVYGRPPAFGEKLRRNSGDMWAGVPLSPDSAQKLTPSNFGPGSLFCVTFCHNVTSDLPGCRSDLEPRVFFYCTLLHALRDLLPGRSLGHSPLHRHPFFVPLFATIQHSARPICPDASLIWGIIPFRASEISKQAAVFFLCALSRILQNPAAGSGILWRRGYLLGCQICQNAGRQKLFLVRIFSNYPKSGRGPFFVLLFSAFPHPGSVLFLCDFSRHFQITGPLPSPLLPQVATFRRVLLPVILLIACCPGSDLPRLRPGYMGGNVGFRLLPICLIWLCKFVGMNSSSLLLPAMRYDIFRA